MKNKILISLIITLCFTFTACGHEHTFTEANCTTPKTCTECGETEGEALGHKWADATCTTAKTCSVCSATEGTALGHNFTEATCTTAKTCSKCGETEGEPLGHKWIEATLEAPKTCELCGLTEGEPLKAPVNSTSDDIILGDDEYKGDDPRDTGTTVKEEPAATTEHKGVDIDGDGKISQSEADLYNKIHSIIEEAANDGSTTTPSGGSSVPGSTGQQGNIVGSGVVDGTVENHHIEWGSGDASGAENAIVY